MRAAARLPLRSQIPVAALLIAAALALLVGRTAPPVAAPAVDQQSSAQSAYGKLPLSFVPNRGQLDSRARFYAQTPGLGVFFGDDKVTLALQKERKGHALELRFPGSSAASHPEPLQRRAGEVNYLTGPDSSKWRTGIPTYGAIRYRGLWPGIDLTFKGAPGALKYELTVHPGADPRDIRLAYAGSEDLSVGDSGALAVATPVGTLTDARPKTFQGHGNGLVPIQSSYNLRDQGSYGFALGRYDRSRSLVIDPGLAYSTFLGQVAGYAIDVDAQGNAYVTGDGNASTFPTTPGAYDTTAPGWIFVTKINPAGSGLVYSTYLNGTDNSFDLGLGIAVDAQGNAYVTGVASSSNFPTTPGAFDTTRAGLWDAFVAKLNATGSALVYSTLLGGAGGPNGFDNGQDIAVDGQGNAYVTGETEAPDFPTTAGAYDTTHNGSGDGFVTKVNPTGSALVYSTFLGGSNVVRDDGVAIAVDGQQMAYVTGRTDSADFPMTPGAFDTTKNGGTDAFVTKLNTMGSALVFSTFLGGNTNPSDNFDDVGSGIAVDGAGNSYVGGTTASLDFPTTAGAFDTTFNGGIWDAFIAKLSASGTSLVYATYLGGVSNDFGNDISLDSRRSAFVTGDTSSSDFPTSSNAYDTTFNERSDAFVSRLDADGDALLYSSFLGGRYVETTVGSIGSDRGTSIALDARGAPYVTGGTESAEFPTTPGAFDTSWNGNSNGGDSFVTKFDLPLPFDAPGEASTLHFSLVPELRQTISASQCQARGGASSTHGAPLVLGSCNPPTFVPGTQARFRGAGSADLTAVTGDLSTPADEADLAIAAALSDVPAAAGGDYNPSAGGPDLTLVARLRISDTNNGASASDPATVADLEYSTPVDCTPTIDPGVGSGCAVATSADSLTPGAILEGRNTVIQSFRVRVHDSGPNAVRGDGDDRRLASQGIYIP